MLRSRRQAFEHTREKKFNAHLARLDGLVHLVGVGRHRDEVPAAQETVEAGGAKKAKGVQGCEEGVECVTAMKQRRNKQGKQKASSIQEVESGADAWCAPREHSGLPKSGRRSVVGKVAADPAQPMERR